MQLQSDDFHHQAKIPLKFTCDGEDISPHLKWSDIPDGTKSFALSCVDPDAPGGKWCHWLIINIPVSIREIAQGQTVGQEIINDFGKPGYGGPCPPAGEHRYFFTVYALDVEIIEGITKENFVEKVNKHALDSAEIMGLYQRG